MTLAVRALPWFLLALLAILAGFAGLDLRLLAAMCCGAAVLAGSGVLERR